MTWKNVLKSPYTISNKVTLNPNNPPKVETTTYDILYQGVQRSQIPKMGNFPGYDKHIDTGYWTAEPEEAMAYAFFGSKNQLGHPNNLKSKAKPRIAIAKKIPEDKEIPADPDHKREIFEDRPIVPPAHGFNRTVIQRVGMGKLPSEMMPDADFVKLAKEFYQKVENGDYEAWNFISHACGISSYSSYAPHPFAKPSEWKPWKPEILKHMRKALKKYYGVQL
tara:strand:- start:198 stop:863 length:666 start_codon:yes stop_codon:yes gene_type:complete